MELNNKVQVDEETRRKREERKARLRASSEAQTQELINQAQRIESGQFSDEEADFIRQMVNPEENNGTTYGTSQTPSIGSNATGINPSVVTDMSNKHYKAEMYYNQTPQYVYQQQQQQFYPNQQQAICFMPAQAQQYPTMQQPQFSQYGNINYNPQMIQTAQQMMTPPSQAQPYYPQQIQSSAYYNPNMYYNNMYTQQNSYQNQAMYMTKEEYLEYINEIEEAKKRQCSTTIHLAQAFRKAAIMGGYETSESEEEYAEKLNKTYGYKTPAQISIEQEEAKKKAMLANTTNMPKSAYDSKGYRYEERTLKVGITDENGVTRVLTPETNNDGKRIIAFSRSDDQMIKYENDHFFDPYIKEMTEAYQFIVAFNNAYDQTTSRFPVTATWEELTGPEAKMADYYDYMVVMPDSNALQAKLIGSRWKKHQWNENFYNSGVVPIVNAGTASNAFYDDYNLAKQIHDMNLARTPEEMCLDNNLTNKLQQTYDQRRAEFFGRIQRGNVRTDMGSRKPGQILAFDPIYSEDAIPNQQVINDVPVMPGGIKPIRRTIETGVVTDPAELERIKNLPITSMEIVDASDGNQF